MVRGYSILLLLLSLLLLTFNKDFAISPTILNGSKIIPTRHDGIGIIILFFFN